MSLVSILGEIWWCFMVTCTIIHTPYLIMCIYTANVGGHIHTDYKLHVTWFVMVFVLVIVIRFIWLLMGR